MTLNYIHLKEGMTLYLRLIVKVQSKYVQKLFRKVFIFTNAISKVFIKVKKTQQLNTSLQ